MTKTSLNLLTIIADEALLYVLEEIISESGARGHTLSHVKGQGQTGSRDNMWEGNNIRLEVITTEDVVEKILTHLHEKLFDKYSIIAYYMPVHVVRSHHFIN